MQVATIRLLCLLALFAGKNAPRLWAAKPDATSEGIEFFERTVRPVLVNHCVECHGPKKQEAGLRLDIKSAAFRGSDVHPVIVAGKLAESPLIDAVEYDGDVQMPPEEKLPKASVDALKHWISIGAPWPDEAEPDLPMEPASPEAIAQARREHWSYQPIVKPTVPVVEGATTEIDAFVLARLLKAGLALSPPADRWTLLRRAAFGITGLPPTFEQTQSFVNNPAADAWQQEIDRLLASSAYGERWARHWLDVARYADTMGYAAGGKDTRYPYAYTYRDYVVQALNEDLPYDQFVLEQLAADLLPGDRHPESLAAIGFLTVGRRFNGRTHEVIDDQIDVVTRGLLGMTVTCARCHDHKYDPIPTADYYSLYGVFASCEEPDELPLIAEPDDSPGGRAFQQELAKRQQAVDSFIATEHANIQQELRRQVDLYMLEVVRRQHPDRIPGDIQKDLAGAIRRLVSDRWQRYLDAQVERGTPLFLAWRRLAEIPAAEFAARASEVIEELKSAASADQANLLVLAALAASPPQSLVDVARVYNRVVTEFDARWQQLKAQHGDAALEKLSKEDRQVYDLLYGERSPLLIGPDDTTRVFNVKQRNDMRALQRKVTQWQAFGDHSPPRAMVVRDREHPHNPHVFLRGDPGRRGPSIPRQYLAVLSAEPRQPFTVGSGRLELAQRIVDPANPRTARVIVNRVWMHHFGRGLVGTPSDFGARGESPTHPLLLDYLSAQFMEHGWSLKWLHREILRSAVYRQQSFDRPAARQIDPENRLLWRMNRQRLEYEALRDSLLFYAGRLDTTIGGRPVRLDKEPFSTRRTLYGLIDRQDLFSTLRVFDVASPDASAGMRPRTTVPQQSLYLMNSPFVIEQARHLAARSASADGSDPAARIRSLYRLVLAREPAREELELAQGLIAAQPETPPENDKLNPWEKLAQVLVLTNEVVFID